MTKKQIKILAEDSYKNEKLDAKTVFSFAKLLNKKDLKEYISRIKKAESKKTVTILIPNIAIKTRLFENEVKKLFNKKKVIFKEEPSLLAGLKIIDDDMVYDFNLKYTLNNIVTYVTK